MSNGLLGWLERELEERVGQRAADLSLSCRAALRGGQAAMTFYGDGDLEVRHKGVGDPVTAADHSANHAILATLADGCPEDPILSEESPPPEGQTAQRLWVVDPLDGTKEFIARNGEFAVMVGLAEHGRAVLGALYRPDPGVLYLGVVGTAAWVVDTTLETPALRPLQVTAKADGSAEPLRFVRSRSHPDERLTRLEERIGDLEIVRSGSVGVKCALIATGRADLYVHPVPFLKEWDTCAPEAVLRAAGGTVTDCAGNELRYGKRQTRQPGGIFAARSDVWNRVAPLVREVSQPLFEG